MSTTFRGRYTAQEWEVVEGVLKLKSHFKRETIARVREYMVDGTTVKKIASKHKITPQTVSAAVRRVAEVLGNDGSYVFIRLRVPKRELAEAYKATRRWIVNG